MNKKALIGLCMAAALASCTHANTKMLDDRTAIISGRGNAYTDMADVASKVLVEAATEAQARGFSYFMFTSTQDATRGSSYTTPTQTYSSGTGYANCSGGSCYGNAYGNSTTYGGQTYNFVKPGMNAMVRFFREGEIDPTANGVWSVARVLAAQEE